MGVTSIPWTDRTWSPLRVRVLDEAPDIARAKGYTSLVLIAEKMAGHVGPHCEAVSHGCDNCYACTLNKRRLPANGTGLPFDRRSRDLVEAFVDEAILLQPMRWRERKVSPLKIFVENQSDLFGPWYTDEMIDQVFAVMALRYREHIFQVLTKRPLRMRDYLREPGRQLKIHQAANFIAGTAYHAGKATPESDEWVEVFDDDEVGTDGSVPWPLPNVWLGVSCEDQTTADMRIPDLLYTPAPIHFVSYEPALGPIEFRGLFGMFNVLEGMGVGKARLNQIIYGGESGSNARPADVQWAFETLRHCRHYDVSFFLKQLGARAYNGKSPAVSLNHLSADPRRYLKLKDRKGENMDEWYEDLRVREFPAVSA